MIDFEKQLDDSLFDFLEIELGINSARMEYYSQVTSFTSKIKNLVASDDYSDEKDDRIEELEDDIEHLNSALDDANSALEDTQAEAYHLKNEADADLGDIIDDLTANINKLNSFISDSAFIDYKTLEDIICDLKKTKEFAETDRQKIKQFNFD